MDRLGDLGAVLGLTRKVLVTDLDNTLWKGVIGEDGLQGIQIGPGSPEGEAHLRLQHYLLDLKSRGILLAVCSKNDPTIAEAVPLGQSLGGGTLIVLLTGGYNVPAGRELGLADVTQPTGGDKIGGRQISQVTMMLFVVNTESGELLWSDKRHELGGTIHKERIMRIASKLVSFLP